MSQITRRGSVANSSPVSTNDNRFRVLCAEAALHAVPFLEDILWDRDEDIDPEYAGFLGLSALRAAITALVACRFPSEPMELPVKNSTKFLSSEEYDPCIDILQSCLEAQVTSAPFFKLEEVLDGFEEISPSLVVTLASKRNAFTKGEFEDYGLDSMDFHLGEWEATPAPGFWPELVEKSETQGEWAFWQEWHYSFFSTNRLSWDLQRRVAEIPDEEWKLGPDHIAKRIEEIRARFELEQQIAKLKEENNRLFGRSRFEIGANGGPELEEAKQVIQEIIWTPIEALDAEAKKEKPDKGVIQRQIERLKSGLKWLGSAAGGAAVGNVVNSVWENPSVWIEWFIPILETAQRWLQALINLVG